MPPGIASLTASVLVTLSVTLTGMLQIMAPGTEKSREVRLRRLAERQGLRLQKSPRRDAGAREFGTYQLVDAAEGWAVLAGPAGFGMSLDDVELWFDKEAVRMFKVSAVLQARGFPAVTVEQRRRFTAAMGELFSSRFVMPAQVQWDDAGLARVILACGGEDAPAAGRKAKELIERNASLVAHIFVGEVTVTSASLLQGWS